MKKLSLSLIRGNTLPCSSMYAESLKCKMQKKSSVVNTETIFHYRGRNSYTPREVIPNHARAVYIFTARLNSFCAYHITTYIFYRRWWSGAPLPLGGEPRPLRYYLLSSLVFSSPKACCIYF